MLHECTTCIFISFKLLAICLRHCLFPLFAYTVVSGLRLSHRPSHHHIACPAIWGLASEQRAAPQSAVVAKGLTSHQRPVFAADDHELFKLTLSDRLSQQQWQSYASSPYSSSPHNANGFSMAQEARNTERHETSWGNARLRNNAVAFVSAGNLVREDPQSSRPESPKLSNEEEDENEDEGDETALIEAAEEQQQSTDEPTKTSDVPPQPLHSFRSTDRPSSSDSDEVIFRGRNSPAKPTTNGSAARSRPTPLTEPPAPAQSDHKDPLQTVEKPLPAAPSAMSTEKPRRRWEQRYSRRALMEQEEEEIMQDYIDNMALDDDDEDEGEESSSKPAGRTEHIRLKKGSGEENAKVQLKSTFKISAATTVDETDEWESADLDDLNDLSTTDEDVLDVSRVLRHRERPRGKQYLVTAIGTEIDEAKWVAHKDLVSTTAIEQIRIYEEAVLSRARASVEVSSSEDEDLEDLIDELGSEQDENDRIFEHTSRMTDEQIARALAKQEQLGMGGEEVMLFDGQEVDDLDDDVNLDEFMNGDSFIPFNLTQHTSNRGRSKRNKRNRDTFPSAAAFADALDEDPYGGFDIMDFDRPSLRPKRKGRKSDFPYDLEDVDEEIAQHLVSTWTKDREKKAARKREKTEAEHEFLVQSAENNNPAVIKARIRQFLVSEANTLELTPMDAAMRASVHRLAKSLKMNSKSQGKDGKGVGRYPVLTKTPYTPQYTVSNIFQVDALMNQRKFFPKDVYRGYKSARTGAGVSRRGFGGGASAASYANGDIVGAAAPEIGAENRGRAMLEKMGWSVGMGIGKEGNKGSIDHVKHVVKTNKAGLG